MNNIFHLLIVIIIYGLYVQYSPTMGGIWIRENSDGIKVFCPSNLLTLMYSPLIHGYFWSCDFLVINFWIYLILYLIIYNSIVFNYA